MYSLVELVASGKNEHGWFGLLVFEGIAELLVYHADEAPREPYSGNDFGFTFRFGEQAEIQ